MAESALPQKAPTALTVPADPDFDLQRPSKVTFNEQVTFRDLPLSVGEWLLTIIVLAIPLANIVLYLYWAFISKGNQSRINFCRAVLILAFFLLVINVLSSFA